jgi:hypothetical protein
VEQSVYQVAEREAHEPGEHAVGREERPPNAIEPCGFLINRPMIAATGPAAITSFRTAPDRGSRLRRSAPTNAPQTMIRKNS